MYQGVKGIDPGFEYNPAKGDTRLDSLKGSYMQKSSALSKAVSEGESEPAEDSLTIPVSKGLDPSAGIKNVITHAAKAIDSVHGDGKLPGCKAVKNNRMNAFGSYYSGMRKIEIRTTEGSTHQELTAVHEIGHYLDYEGLKKGEGALRATDCTDDPKIKKVLDAIANSDAIKEGDKYYTGSFREYFMRPREQFARAYAQYIATKSEDSVLMEQLKNMQADEYNPYYQWSDSDFRTIMKAIDELLEDNGWLEKKK